LSSPPPLDRVGIALRVALFVFLAWLGMIVFPLMMYPLAGLLVTSALGTFAAGAVANTVAVRIFERGTPEDIGLGWNRNAGRDLLAGFAMAAGAAGLMLGTFIALRLAVFESSPAADHPAAALAFIFVTLLFGAAGEELLFHGYAFQLLVRSLGAFATILPVGVLFGLVHLGNQNATLLSVFNTMAWGMLLGYAYVRTRALWLPIGLHFGWNFALPVFGVNLSGFTMGVTGYTLQFRSGELWSGGLYGPEGGLPTTVVVAALAVLIPRLIRSHEGQAEA
jgi:membrane protease YdiL (CAAX protease family)